jgi:hypothetical protein
MVCEGREPLTRPATAGESAVAGHPLPKGEGCISDFGPPSPAEDVGNDQPRGRGCPTKEGGSLPVPFDFDGTQGVAEGNS